MTIKIDLNEILELFKTCAPDGDGWVSTSLFLDRVAIRYDCKPLTARNFVLKNSSYFEMRHGRIRLRIEAAGSIAEQGNAQAEFETWQAEREALLNECVQFLSTKQGDPYVENLLIQIALARDELKSYNDAKLASIVMDLRRDYSFIPSKELTEK
jgi:hypothetical protein